MPLKQPWPIRILTLVLALTSAFHWLSAISGWQQSTLLTRLELPLLPIYWIISGVVWGSVFAGLALGVWLGQGWARFGAVSAWLFSIFQDLTIRALFGQTAYVRSTWLWELALGVIMMVLLLMLFAPRSARRWFATPSNSMAQ